MDNYAKYMNLALELSLKAQGLTSPNPLVGAVIVKKARIISCGFHKRAGLDHAEIVALKKAGKRAKGATLYVTLEPCCSFGRTPPCSQAIIRSGINKVVVGLRDPNPKHRGNGIKILNKHGIDVVSGILEKRIRQINQPFIKYITKRMPYITLKVAQSLDGKIATKHGESRWITSVASRKFAHKIRSNFDAIMVGINTVLKDNPLLNPTSKTKSKKFYKIVLDTHLDIKTNSRIFKDSPNFAVIIACERESILNKKEKIRTLIKKGAVILGIKNKNNLLDLGNLFKKLAQLEIMNVLVEGGGSVAGSLFDEGLVDYVLFFVSPSIIGGSESVSSIQGTGANRIIDLYKLKNVKIKNLNKDLLIEGAIKEY